MPDPDVQASEEQLWGLTPGVPPALAPTQAQAQAQPAPAPAAPTPAPSAIDTGVPPQVPETSRWGTEESPDRVAQVNDAEEFETNRREERRLFGSSVRSVIGDNAELPSAFRRENHPEYGKLTAAEQALAETRDPKVVRQFKPQVEQLRKKIDHEVQVRDQQARATRREQLARDDAPYTSPDARAKTAETMNTPITTAVADAVAQAGHKDPKIARQWDYNVTVSPITTMSKPKGGTSPDEKFNPANRDFTPLRDAATSIATHNRGLSNDASVFYSIKLGTPGGGTDDKGNQVKGFNGRYGAGATNYKVVGRDDLDNWLLQMDDGKKLRVPDFEYKQFTTARLQGVKRAKEWEENYKKQQQPGLLGRALEYVIPKKGF